MAENKAQQSRGDSTLPEADEEQPEREGNIHGKLRQYGPGRGRPRGFSKLGAPSITQGCSEGWHVAPYMGKLILFREAASRLFSERVP